MMPSSSSLRTANTNSRSHRVRLLLVIEAAAAATPPKTARFVAGARVCGEGWEVPVGLEAAEGIVPVGLVGMVAVRLPVGAAGTSAVAAAGAVAALALTVSSSDAVLTSGQQVRRGVQGPFPGLDVVSEVKVR